MDINVIRGVVTAIFLFTFIVMIVWVFLPSRKHRYDDAASLPLDDTQPLHNRNKE